MGNGVCAMSLWNAWGKEILAGPELGGKRIRARHRYLFVTPGISLSALNRIHRRSHIVVNGHRKLYNWVWLFQIIPIHALA